jgi:DNA mismatch endonuclease, patch repair protein
MRRVRSRDTTAELLLRRELFRAGLRYRVNVKRVPGCPDIVFMNARLAVFVDGDFWHGHQWVKRGLTRLEDQFHNNKTYWIAKIQRTIERDAANTARLEELGWIVIRLWETDVIADSQACLRRVRLALKTSQTVSIAGDVPPPPGA